MPTRYTDAILNYLASREYRPLKVHQLARRMGVSEEEYGTFRDAVKQLADAGRVVLGAKSALTLPQIADRMVGFYRANPRGFGFVVPETPNAHGDLFIPPGHQGGALTGDLVAAKVESRGKREGKDAYAGQIVEIIQRGQSRFVGTLRRAEGNWFVLPDGSKGVSPITLPDMPADGPAEGSKVVVEIVQYGAKGELPTGVLAETLGAEGNLEVETRAVIRAHGIREDWPEAVLEAARRANAEFDPSRAPGREDLTGKTIVTIDPPDAKDFDDAVSLDALPGGGWTLGVHIADVSHFVIEGSPLDEEARLRATSTYFPRRVVPMLPEVLSNGVCSLQERQPRFCKSAFITYDAEGNVRSTRFADTVISSAKRLTYDQAQAICDGRGMGLPRGEGVSPSRPAGILPATASSSVASSVASSSSSSSSPAENLQASEGIDEIRKRQGRNLPHWTKGGASYAVTFRLADSLPPHILQGWMQERETILQRAKLQGRPLTTHEERELDRLYSTRVEAFLDSGQGACHLAKREFASMVQEALRHFDGERYDLIAWCVMPNHVHVIVRPLAGNDLAAILHSWKSFSAKQANKRMGKNGAFWEDEYYDHLIRDEEDFYHHLNYLLGNPEKAGLKAWEWVGTQKKKQEEGTEEARGQDARETRGQDALATPDARDAFPPAVIELVQRMEKLARLIEERRRKAGMLHLDLPEVQLVLDPAGKVIDAVPEDAAYSHTVIEMFMVEANEAVAELFSRQNRPCLRRIHPDPAGEDVKQLSTFLRACGHRIATGLSHRDLQGLLEGVKGRPESYAINLAILRTFEQAEYSPMLVGHFALASRNYCHFTSPIRRYPDLTIHRLLGEYNRGRLADRPPEDMSALTRLGQHCSACERRSQAAETELRQVLVLQLMQTKIGETFDGVVTGVAGFGIFVQLRRLLIEGLIRLEELGDDWWEVDARAGSVRGQMSGRRVRIGDLMNVTVAGVDVARRQLNLVPAREQGKGQGAKPPAQARKKRK